MQLFLNRSESEFGEACMVFGCQKTICFLMFFVYLILGVNLLQFLLHLQLITLFNLHIHLLYFLPEQKLDGMWNGFS